MRWILEAFLVNLLIFKSCLKKFSESLNFLSLLRPLLVFPLNLNFKRFSNQFIAKLSFPWIFSIKIYTKFSLELEGKTKLSIRIQKTFFVCPYIESLIVWLYRRRFVWSLMHIFFSIYWWVYEISIFWRKWNEKALRQKLISS